MHGAKGFWSPPTGSRHHRRRLPKDREQALPQSAPVPHVDLLAQRSIERQVQFALGRTGGLQVVYKLVIESLKKFLFQNQIPNTKIMAKLEILCHIYDIDN